jgi:hypothetical protein
MAYRRPSRRSTSKPQWLAIVTTLVSLVNALMRVASMFRSKARKVQPIARAEPGLRRSRSAKAAPPTQREAAGSDGGIGQLFRDKTGDVQVTAAGRVVKVLTDDLVDHDGTGQHQRFLVELNDRDRTTIKISHNLAFGRVPVREGHVVSFHGEYEYNELGGCVHWTHHDPKGWHADGYIELEGKRYG